MINTITMANKVYSLLDFGAEEGKQPEEKTVKSEIYSDISMVGTRIGKNSKKLVVAKVTDVQAVKTALNNLFKFLPGERVLNPDFGNKLYGLLYNPAIDYTKEKIAAEITSMVSKYEPRAVIDSIIDNTRLSELEDNSIQFIIEWHVVGFENVKYRLPLP